MCGITGMWRLDGRSATASESAPFAKSLKHRGPDGFGLESFGSICLGHTRLAIQDLSEAGRQPMPHPNKNLWLTFNGEIFNFIELRDDLEKRGVAFHTNSDSEVLLQAFYAWGEKSFHKFNGMWAFAIWNHQNRELLICRDRFGIKPLYYAFIPGKLFAFASETNAFRKLPDFVREKDERKVATAIRSSFALESTGLTIFKDIYSLKPGHCLKISESQPKPVLHKWWNTADHILPSEGSYEQQLENFKFTLNDACKIRLRSDVKPCGALSGGVDSSSIFALSRNIEGDSRSQKINDGFTLTFPGTDFDEEDQARRVSGYLGARLHTVTVPKNDIAHQLESMTRKMDFIYQNPPVVQHIYQAMRREGFCVSLEGHGGDELLYGYPSMIRNAAILFQQKGQQNKTTNALDVYGKISSPQQRKNLNELLQREMKPKLSTTLRKKLSRLFPPQMQQIRWSLYHHLRHQSWLRLSPDTMDSKISCDVADIAYNEVHSYRLPTLLRNWDHASMHYGVESRMPLLDWRVVCLSLSLPFESRCSGYTKRILRDSVKGLLPETIRLQSNKIGINSPIDQWFTGQLRQMMHDIISSRDFKSSSIWDGQRIAKWFEKTDRFNFSEATILWPFINANLIK